MTLLGLSGYAQSGKDTAADYLESVGFERRAFADALRNFASAINFIVDFDERENEFVRYNDVIEELGYNEGKVAYSEIREMLQRIGTEGGRKTLYDNVWVDAAMKDGAAALDCVFTDVRFPNEAEAIQEAGGHVIRIVRPGVEAVNAHASETSLDDWDFDDYIVNDGTIQELHGKVAIALRDSKLRNR